MMEDPIVAEVRRAREEIAKRFNYDLRAMFEDARRRQAQSGRKVVSFPPRWTKKDGGAAMGRVIEGVVHGRTVELSEDPGVSDGERVQVVLSSGSAEEDWKRAVMRTAGALADDPDWDRIMAEVHQARKIGGRPRLEDA
jgi:hypothetical protein